MVVIMPLNTIMYYIMCMDYIGHGVILCTVFILIERKQRK